MFGHARMISHGLHFVSPSQYDTKNNREYIKWFFSIGYFERYFNSNSDYLELLLSVYTEEDDDDDYDDDESIF